MTIYFLRIPDDDGILWENLYYLSMTTISFFHQQLRTKKTTFTNNISFHDILCYFKGSDHVKSEWWICYDKDENNEKKTAMVLAKQNKVECSNTRNWEPTDRREKHVYSLITVFFLCAERWDPKKDKLSQKLPIRNMPCIVVMQMFILGCCIGRQHMSTLAAYLHTSSLLAH